MKDEQLELNFHEEGKAFSGRWLQAGRWHQWIVEPVGEVWKARIAEPSGVYFLSVATAYSADEALRLAKADWRRKYEADHGSA